MQHRKANWHHFSWSLTVKPWLMSVRTCICTIWEWCKEQGGVTSCFLFQFNSQLFRWRHVHVAICTLCNRKKCTESEVKIWQLETSKTIKAHKSIYCPGRKGTNTHIYSLMSNSGDKIITHQSNLSHTQATKCLPETEFNNYLSILQKN